MSDCPPVEQLQLLLDDQLSDAEERTLAAHVDCCGSCQERLEHLTRAVDRPAGQLLEDAEPQAGTVRVERWLQRPPRAAQANDRAAAPEPSESWPQVEGYEILGELGRGGMGVVYKARQLGLNRLVALKMILDAEHAGAERLTRFRREAEAIARLQHPHIVQIHDIGEQDGRPFFAMELVAGGSLADHLDGTPLNPHAAAGLVETLARAVHAAHEQGIIHRDLKPANVLLSIGPSGSTESNETNDAAQAASTRYAVLRASVPKISDFGLAKHVPEPATTASATRPAGQTKSGMILGSPSYMSPEQAEAKPAAVGPLADVYGLGAILYELLTGRPPFKAESALETVLQVLHEEAVPPRRLQPKLPRDLDTICLTCLRKEPYRRYASALALAEDLRRFQASEPIRARPTGMVERGLKWSRRRPAFAALLAVSVAACIILGIEDHQYKARLVQARDLAENQRDRADSNFRLARDAVDKTVTKIAGNPLLKQANFHQLRCDLLESMVPFYEQFVKQHEKDPELEAERGRAWGSLATLRHELGQNDEARSDCEQICDLFAQLANDFPTEPKYRLDLAKTYSNLGILLHDEGKHGKAEAAYRDALKIQARLVADFPKVPEYRQNLASGYNNLGNLLDDLGKHGEAEDAYHDALKIQAQLATDFPKVPEYRQELARKQNNLGILLHNRGKHGEAEAAYRDALKIQAQLVADFPKVPEYRQVLASNYNNFGLLLVDLGKRVEAEAAYRDALKIQAQLTTDFPTVPEYKHGMALSHNHLGVLLFDLGKRGDAEAAFRDALRIRVQLVADFPKVPQYRKELAGSHNNLGILLRHLGKRDEAEAAFRDAVKISAQLAADFPTVPKYRQELARNYYNWADLLGELGKRAEAETAYRDALKIQAQLATDFPKVPEYRRDLARSHGDLGILLDDLGKRVEAEAAFRDALKIRAQLAADFPTVPHYRQELAGSYHNLGNLLRELGKRGEAEAACRDALKIQAQLAKDFPRVPDYQHELAATLVDLAILARSGKDPAQARQLLEQAIPHHQAALKANDRDPTYRAGFRTNRQTFAETLLDLGDHKAASDTAGQLIQAAVDPAPDVYNAARFLARCVPLAERDAQLSEAERQQLAQTYANRALAVLRQAVQNGYKDVAHMRKDTDLDPLRSHPEFQKLLEELDRK